MSSVATTAARDTVRLTTGRSRERSWRSIVFLGGLWFSLFFGVMVLVVLVVDTLVVGAPRFDADLITSYDSTLFPERTGFRAGILGSIWLMLATALLAVPLGIGAALYLEEFADSDTWYNRLIEVNLQNLAAVPSVIYGLLAVAVMALVGYERKGIVLGGAIALALLILPVIIIATRESVRAVPNEIRFGSLALGATTWQTTWRQILPASVPGIATGTILGLSRAIGEAAPLLLLGIAGAVRFDPTGLESSVTALPIQIYRLSSESQEEYQVAASAAIIVLLVMILGMNALAIFIRNKFQEKLVTMSTHPRTLTIGKDEATATQVGNLAEVHEEADRTLPDLPPDPVMEAMGLNVFYGDFHAVHDVNLSFGRNEITALIGPSGCGKSTVLRCLNRMNDLVPGARVEGEVTYHGQNIYTRGVDPIAVRTNIGMVFQKPNPFPKSIYDNVAYGPRVIGMKVDDMDDLVEQALRDAALWDEVKDKLKQSAYGLSGGQQQRLCIARTIATRPDVILMDEPCSALDPIATARVEDLMLNLRDEYTIIIVTHNMQQAARVSDRTAFFTARPDETTGNRTGLLVEFNLTSKIFANPVDKRTEDYISGRFG